MTSAQSITTQAVAKTTHHANEVKTIEANLRDCIIIINRISNNLVSKVNKSIVHISSTIKAIVQFSDILNSVLPEDERLEPLSSIFETFYTKREQERQRMASNAMMLPKSNEIEVIESNILKSATNIEDLLGGWIKSKETALSPIKR
jgi:hypothetical protein